MSKRKPIELPKEWLWYGVPFGPDYLFPARPTLLEIAWVYIGAPMPVTETVWEEMHKRITNWNEYSQGRARVVKRKRKPIPPDAYYDSYQVNIIADYFLHRDTKPLRPPAVPSYDNPFL